MHIFWCIFCIFSRAFFDIFPYSLNPSPSDKTADAPGWRPSPGGGGGGGLAVDTAWRRRRRRPARRKRGRAHARTLPRNVSSVVRGIFFRPAATSCARYYTILPLIYPPSFFSFQSEPRWGGERRLLIFGAKVDRKWFHIV